MLNGPTTRNLTPPPASYRPPATVCMALALSTAFSFGIYVVTWSQ